MTTKILFPSKSKLLSFIQLLRPEQYSKNIFIFFPLFFASQFLNSIALYHLFGAFIAFSLTASGIYVINDYFDIETDKTHPTKKNRPLASGSISKKEAHFLIPLLLIGGFSIMSLLSIQALLVLMFYVVINISYTLHIKHIAILDVTTIALGFILRLLIGAIVADIPLSSWIVIMTFLLALFLALAKRRDDMLIYLNTGKKMRKVIDGYNLQFLDSAMLIMSSVTIVTYMIYVTSPNIIEQTGSNYLYITLFFVILGFMRYLKMVFIHKNSSSPTKILFNDLFIQLVLLGWLLTFAWILY